MLKKYAADLRKARERRNITLSDVSNKTRIHISLLEKMESGNFTFFNATYVRAFIRQYAKTIGLNPDEVLYNFELAKRGKYTSRPDDTPPPTPPPEKDPGNVITSGKDFNSSFERAEYSELVTAEPISEKQENGFEERKRFSNSKKIKLESNNSVISADDESGFRLSASLFKNIGIGIVLILLGIGIYLLVKTVFLPKSGSDVEIIRLNTKSFDDIVKENEKKILGKRSEEEIKDSINKAVYRADSLKKAENDSITLLLRGIGRGAISIYIDTVLTGNLWSERFIEGDSASYKAKNCFLISSKNTKSFILFLNGKQIKIADDNIKLLKITRRGIEN